MPTRLERDHLIVNPLARVRAYTRVDKPWREEARDEMQTRDFRNLREFDEWWKPGWHGELNRKDGTGFGVHSRFLFTDVLLNRIDDAPVRGPARTTVRKNGGGTATPRKHQQVQVGGVTYNSVFKAFEAIGLSIPAHAKFRAELKKSPGLEMTYTENGKSYDFKIVE